MKHILIIIAFLHFLIAGQAQLKNVIVEKYYISDTNDAKNIEYIYNNNGDVIDSVILKEGTTTYRVFVQLDSLYKLIKIFGDVNHELKIYSTSEFYNNVDFGQSFGNDIVYRRLKENAVALDTWLSLGQTTTTNVGVLKTDDKNGSVVGGTHNKLKMLVNNDTLAGIPITKADGMDTLINTPSLWIDKGFKNSARQDSTIFGSLRKGTEFISNNASIQNSGMMGFDSIENKIIIAQLTTHGDISFNFNIQVMSPDKQEYTFVAKKAPTDSALGYIYSPFLTYPPVCGCIDPNYLEYNPIYQCNNKDSCHTKIVYGCLDPAACNYDPKANFPMQSLCCYPGFCSNRDISVVCPDLSPEQPTVSIFPNPVSDKLYINVSNFNSNSALLKVYDLYGKKYFENTINTNGGNSEFDISNFAKGIYLLHIQNTNGLNITKYIVKN